MENPKPTKTVGFQEFIPSVLSDVEKFAEFNCTIVFKSEQNVGDIVENWHGRLKLTLVVNAGVC